jgi:hypothetical protein
MPTEPPAPNSRQSSRFSVRSRHLGQLLIEDGGVQPELVAKALQIQAQQGGLLGQILRSLGACGPEAVAAALHKQLQITDVRCEDLQVTPGLIERVNPDLCQAERLCPFELLGNTLCVVMANPLNRDAIARIEQSMGARVKAFKAPWPKIRDLLDRSLAAASNLPISQVAPSPLPVVEQELSMAPPVQPAPRPVLAPAPTSSVHIEGLERLDEEHAEVIQLDRRRPGPRPPVESPGPAPPAKVNVNLDRFEPDKAAELVSGSEAGRPASPPRAQAAIPAPQPGLPPELAPAPPGRFRAVEISEAEFAKLVAGLRTDPVGEWLSDYAVPGPVTAREYAP